MPTSDGVTAEMHRALREAVRARLAEDIELLADLRISMRDGIVLVADAYRPKAVAQPLPVVLSVAPYIKELQLAPALLTHSIEAGPTTHLVRHGFIHVIATHRGAGESQGRYDHISRVEQQDMYDLVEWIARQPWCDGNVGMTGDSHYAVNAMWAAAQQPPHLRCVVAYDAYSDFYRDMVYPGGVFRSLFTGVWLSDAIPQFQWPGPVPGRLPPANQLQDYVDNPFDGPYWTERSLRTQFHRLETPTLHLVPRSANHSRGQLLTFTNQPGPKKVVVLPPPAYAKEHWLYLKSEPLIAYMLQWFDHWLKGVDTPIMREPDVAIFDVGSQQWYYDTQYPAANLRWTPYYLSGDGAEARGKLLIKPAAGEQSGDVYALPDWEKVAAGEPVLEYSTDPLLEPVRLWGPVCARIFAATTALDTAFFVHLADIAPDGSVTALSNGVLKASFREVDPGLSAPAQPFHPFDRRQLPERNRVYDYEIEMRPVFHTLKRGHRLRCRIQSNDPNFMTFLHGVYNTEMLPWPSSNSIFHDVRWPSQLLLPIVPAVPPDRTVSAPLCDVTWPIKNLDWSR